MRISVTPNGPYVVDDRTTLHRARRVTTDQGEPVAWEHDAPLPTEESYLLCRCGASGNKPFCDGSHASQDWDGTETAATSSYDDRAKTLPGSGMSVRDDRGLCEHAGFCSNKLSNVWKMVRDSDSTTVKTQLAGMVGNCPSGALTFRLDGTTRDLEPDLAPGIAVTDDGPLRVTGGVTVERADGQPLESRNRMTLCRCGASKNKPLCDGSHTDIGFRDGAAH